MANLTNLNNKFLVTTGGDVGINSTAPTTKLHVVGVIKAENTGSGAELLQLKYGSSGDAIFVKKLSSTNGIEFNGFDGTSWTNNILVIEDTGNVGINTTSPAQKLEIAGGYLKFSGGDYGIQGSASLTYNPVSDHYFQASGSTKVTFKADGNVGIGTLSPTSPAGVARFLEIEGSTAGIVLHDDGNDPYEIWASGGNLVFRYNNTAGENGMLLSSLGSLGIGTTSPDRKLHVSSADNQLARFESTDAYGGIEICDNSSGTAKPLISALANDFIFYGGGSSHTQAMSIGGSGKVIVGADSSNALEVFSSGDTEIGFSYATRGNIYAKIIGDITQASPLGGELAFQTATGGSLSERMRITAAGKVGIGTAIPDFELEVAGSIGIDEYIYHNGDHNTYIRALPDEWVFRTGGDDRFTISNTNTYFTSTNVGIGTTSPDTLLNLEGAVNTSIITLGCTKNDASWSGERIGGINFYSADGSGPGASVRGSINYIATSTSGGDTAMTFATGDNTTRMTIDNDGDVGIGYTAPAKRLDVNYSNSGQEGASLILRNLAGGSGAYNRIYFAPTASDYATRSCIIQGENVDGNNNMALVFKTGAGASPSERMRIDQNGDISMTGSTLQVGNGSANVLQKIWGTATAGIQIFTNSPSSGTKIAALEQYFANEGYLGLRYDGTETVRLRANDSSFFNGGNVGIGTTSPASKLEIEDANNRTQSTSQFRIEGNGYTAFHWLDATAYYINQNSDLRSLRIYSGTSGGVELAAGGTSWGTFSDETEKENLKPLENVLDKIKDYRCVKFNFKEDKSKETKIGFIAQDWENDFSEVVYKSKNKEEEEKLAMKYTETIPVLLKAIQELKAEIELLKSK